MSGLQIRIPSGRAIWIRITRTVEGGPLTPLSLPDNARRLDSMPLSDHVYRALRDAICDGAFEPHEHLVQNRLAEQLNVSRTPVRDALLRLSQEGLIRAVGVRGYVVQELTARDVDDVYEVRLFLEPQAVALGFKNLTDRQIDEMVRLNAEIAHPERHPDDYYELNRSFHEVLIQLCPNSLMRRILSGIWELPVSRRIFRQQMAGHLDVPRMVAEHDGLIEAVRSRDCELVMERLRHHLSESRQEAGAGHEPARPARRPRRRRT